MTRSTVRTSGTRSRARSRSNASEPRRKSRRRSSFCSPPPLRSSQAPASASTGARQTRVASGASWRRRTRANRPWGFIARRRRRFCRRQLSRTNFMSARRTPNTPIWRTAMTDRVLYQKKGEVACVTLNRPEAKNAIDLEMHRRLREIWTDFRDDARLRVAVITGTGDAFCAGADLKTHVPEWAGVGPSLARDKLPDGFAGGITRGLHRLYKPIIAACNGWVLGGGLELAMACDIRIASERAQFGSFELRRGMHPADGGIVRLVNTCGVGVALVMELTGEPIPAQRALAANLVSRVVPHAELMAPADHMVARILRNT